MELLDLAPTLLEYAGVTIPDTMQGRSLVSLLQGDTDLHTHRDFVRAEYYGALNPNAPDREDFVGIYATMIRTRRYKQVSYHGLELGELFDLEQDPHEFHNLWQDPVLAAVRFRLMQQNFDALAFAVDPGAKQLFYY